MRKILNSLLLLSLLLVLNVKADMGPPAFPKLKGEVKNDNTKCYKDMDFKEVERVLAKGTVIEVENYGAGEYSYHYDLTNEEAYCYIHLEDLNFFNQKYELSNEDKLEKEIDLMVIESKGVEMYKGPSTYFEKLNKVIPKGTKLKTQYRMGDFWYYVTYDGVSGYISSEKTAIVNNEVQGQKYFTVYAINIQKIGSERQNDENNEKINVIGEIPANTLIEVNWSTDYDRYYYVDYNGTTGLIGKMDGFAEGCSGGKIVAKRDLDVYDNLGSKRAKIGTVSKGKEYAVSYCYDFYDEEGYYITELKGWIYNRVSESNYLPHVDFVKYTNSKGEDPYEGSVVLEKLEIKGHDIGFAKNKTEYTVELSEEETKLEFVVTPDEVDVEVLNNEDLKNNSVVTLKVKDEDGTHTYTFKIVKAEKPGDVQPPTPKPEPTPDDKKGLTNEELIMICVGAGILIAVTILVVIKLVNKKKKEEVEPIQNNNDNSNLE